MVEDAGQGQQEEGREGSKQGARERRAAATEPALSGRGLASILPM